MKLVILDRDGVINEDSDAYIKSPQEWIPVPGSLAAIARLNLAGLQVAVATNQSGIARGYYTEAILAAMHEKMHRLLAQQQGKVDYIAYCPHGPDEGCTCRKPKPGMLLEIMQYFGVTGEQTIFVGDTASDWQAAKNAGTAFALVKTGKGHRTLDSLKDNKKLIDLNVFDSLTDCADWLCDMQYDSSHFAGMASSTLPDWT